MPCPTPSGRQPHRHCPRWAVTGRGQTLVFAAAHTCSPRRQGLQGAGRRGCAASHPGTWRAEHNSTHGSATQRGVPHAPSQSTCGHGQARLHATCAGELLHRYGAQQGWVASGSDGWAGMKAMEMGRTRTRPQRVGSPLLHTARQRTATTRRLPPASHVARAPPHSVGCYMT